MRRVCRHLACVAAVAAIGASIITRSSSFVRFFADGLVRVRPTQHDQPANLLRPASLQELSVMVTADEIAAASLSDASTRAVVATMEEYGVAVLQNAVPIDVCTRLRDSLLSMASRWNLLFLD